MIHPSIGYTESVFVHIEPSSVVGCVYMCLAAFLNVRSLFGKERERVHFLSLLMIKQGNVG